MISFGKKRFPEWSLLKEKLHSVNRVPVIREGEIWWVAIGENVGVEINGKNSVFSRPILVFKKLSRHAFMGIPLTSQFHEGSWYVSFTFQSKKEYAVLAQARVVSVSRLYTKIGEVSDTDYALVLDGFKKLYIDK